MTTEMSVRLRAHQFLRQKEEKKRKKNKNRADSMWQSPGTVFPKRGGDWKNWEAFRGCPCCHHQHKNTTQRPQGSRRDTQAPSWGMASLLFFFFLYFGNFALSSHCVVCSVMWLTVDTFNYTALVQCWPLCKDLELMVRGFRADILSWNTAL